MARGKGHLSIMTEQGSQELLEEMDGFFREALGGDVNQ